MAIELSFWLGELPRATAFWVALLFTYAVHALLWATAAALWVRTQKIQAATQRAVWLLALFAPAATAGFSSAAPAAGAPAGREVRILAWGSSESTPSIASPPRPAGGALADGLVLGMAAAVALGSLRFVVATSRVARQLRRRRLVTDPRLLERLERLRARTALPPLLLTESVRITSPIVLGRREICVPRALDLLDDAEIDAIFAHEMGHLERGDGVWFPAVAAVQSLLWLQPLNHWVGARFRESAELACDDRAVELTGDALALARALARIAERALLGSPASMTPAIARSRSGLMARVRRLTRGRVSSAEPAPPWYFVTFTLLGVATAGLSVRPEVARPPLSLRPGSNAVPLVAAAESASSSAALDREMGDLAQRDGELQQALARAEADALDAETSPRVLELHQELRHVRETAAWLEARRVEALESRQHAAE